MTSTTSVEHAGNRWETKRVECDYQSDQTDKPFYDAGDHAGRIVPYSHLLDKIGEAGPPCEVIESNGLEQCLHSPRKQGRDDPTHDEDDSKTDDPGNGREEGVESARKRSPESIAGVLNWYRDRRALHIASTRVRSCSSLQQDGAARPVRSVTRVTRQADGRTGGQVVSPSGAPSNAPAKSPLALALVRHLRRPPVHPSAPTSRQSYGAAPPLRSARSSA
jgi:hypothetical protein